VLVVLEEDEEEETLSVFRRLPLELELSLVLSLKAVSTVFE